MKRIILIIIIVLLTSPLYAVESEMLITRVMPLINELDSDSKDDNHQVNIAYLSMNTTVCDLTFEGASLSISNVNPFFSGSLDGLYCRGSGNNNNEGY